MKFLSLNPPKRKIFNYFTVRRLIVSSFRCIYKGSIIVNHSKKRHLESNRTLALNTFTAIMLQIVTVVCGFILPKLILGTYGSNINGLVSSIAQFLQVVAFLELGMGAVIQAELYKPISDNDHVKTSEIIACGNAFFRKIALSLSAYILLLMWFYPAFIDNDFGYLFDIELILAMGIGSFVQYYFGIVDLLFLNANQKGYIKDSIYAVTLILNTIGCFVLIELGFSIQIVKFTTSLIFIARPIIIRWYINRHYIVDRNIRFKKDVIKQKWNGIAQHIAAVILDGTDIIVLSLFSNFANVSIYSVYGIVFNNVKNLFFSSFSGIQSMMGNLWAKNDLSKLNTYFCKMEWIVHFLSVLIWLCTYKLIVPFVLLYTKGVIDVSYDVPLFAMLICVAYYLFTIRLTFNTLILSVGHFKKTQKIFIIAAALNVFISVISVSIMGLIGVAIGTFISLLYQYIHMQYYCVKVLRIYGYKESAKQWLVDLIEIGLFLAITNMIVVDIDYVFSWLKDAVIVFIIALAIVSICNALFYTNNVISIIGKLIRNKI